MWRDMLFVEDNTYVYPLPEKGMACLVRKYEEGDWSCTSCGPVDCKHVTAAETATFYHEKLQEFSAMPAADFDTYYDKWWQKRYESMREYEEGGRRYERADAFFQALQDAMKEKRRRPNPNPSPDEDALTYLYEKKEVS